MALQSIKLIKRGGESVYVLSIERTLRVQDEIIKALEKENCTVKEAQYILSQVSRAINATSPVQFLEGLDYEL